MKRLLLFLLVLSTISCSVDDDSIKTREELLPTSSVIIPETVTVGEAEEFIINYIRPTDCHAFNDIYYNKEDNTRNVAVIGIYFESNGNCTTINAETQASFNFKAETTGIYTFKFWTGINAAGENSYLIKEVEAID